MCGRYRIEPAKDGWPALADLLTPAELAALRSIEPRPNIRPTQKVPVIRWAKDDPTPKLVEMRWGFIPPWWKQDKPPQSTFNARCEEAPEKPMWRQAVRNARCLIPNTGWYEWAPKFDPATGEVKLKRDGKPEKEPYEIRNPAAPAICFAGLWSRATFKGDAIETCTIVTRPAISPLDAVHDRMPVIVSPDDYRDWLDPNITDVALFKRVTTAEPPARFDVLKRSPEDFRLNT